MQESKSLIDNKRRRKTALSFFTYDSPETFLGPKMPTFKAEAANEMPDQAKDVPENKDDEEDLDINLEGMDIDNLALDGTAAMNALNDVLHKIGIDVSENEGAKKQSKKQMSPWEIKSNIQTQIIIHLGRYTFLVSF